jgi:hypothetical protein
MHTITHKEISFKYLFKVEFLLIANICEAPLKLHHIYYNLLDHALKSLTKFKGPGGSMC